MMPGDQEKACIILRAGDAECELWPAVGGSIARWSIGTQEMFRRASADALSEKLPLGMASFPLVPYSNRIGFGRFDWRGQPVKLQPNFPPEPHAIHGTGWTTAWGVSSLGADSATLRYAHHANIHWPWSFEAEQRIALSEHDLTVDLIAHNASNEPAPLAFGLHPYFDGDGATLSFHAGQVWRTGSDGLPAFAERPTGVFDFSNGDPVQGRVLDNGFAAWDGNAHIRWDGRPLRLMVEADMQAAVVYVPDGKNFFCFEPVPHIINALNLADHSPQMPLVAPGASFEAQIRFKTTAV